MEITNRSLQSYFNPRSREGSDAKAGNFGIFLPISIHAPARGATYSVVSKNNHFSNFNPRSREGSDKKNNHKILVTMISIHAPARGATFTARADLLSRKGFQSTLPRGERQLEDLRTINPKIISIHAPARGATTFDADRDKINIISIHAPARGATPL